MKTTTVWIVLTIAAAITIYGVISGRFFFLFFMLPLGLGFFKIKNKDDDN